MKRVAASWLLKGVGVSALVAALAFGTLYVSLIFNFDGTMSAIGYVVGLLPSSLIPGEEEHEFSRSIEARVRMGSGTVLRLDEFTAFDWDHVFVYKSFAQPGQINKRFGADVVDDGDAAAQSDGYNLLVFTLEGKAVAKRNHPQWNGDFSPLARQQGWTREEAIFVVVEGTRASVPEGEMDRGWYLVPRGEYPEAVTSGGLPN